MAFIFAIILGLVIGIINKKDKDRNIDWAGSGMY